MPVAVPDTEKLSINLGVVDLGQIDLLVDQGFYSNRTDFIRTATRNLLQTHAPVIQGNIATRAMSLGVIVFDRKSLEKKRAMGSPIDIHSVGLVTIADDVSPELAKATIRSVKVFGVLRASSAVKAALQGKLET
jgi:Arc/MetJ-type ribon-helix-helix transcriptional regulator